MKLESQRRREAASGAGRWSSRCGGRSQSGMCSFSSMYNFTDSTNRTPRPRQTKVHPRQKKKSLSRMFTVSSARTAR
eukprot:scaffold94132_cov32-Tisochrysis_lutea.AAC.1